MRTTNPELLAEIDGLCQMSGVESHQLEVTKRIEELESALTEISRVADFPPVDKIISGLARQALNKK